MILRSIHKSVPVLIAAAALAGCTPKPASVNVSPASAALSESGAKATLSADVLDKDGKAIDKSPVAWSSSNPAVASVDNGTVTAVKSGKATITAAAGTVTGSAEVTVSIPAKIEVNPAEVALQVAAAEAPADGSTPPPASATIAALVKDDADQAVTGAQVSYASGDPAIAVVDAAGLVSAVAAGETTVTVTSGSLSASVKVTVTAPPPPPPAKGKKK